MALLVSSTHPELRTLWSEKNDLAFHGITSTSRLKVWWKCSTNFDHPDFLLRVDHRVNGSSCPICGGTKPWIGVTDLGSTHPELAKVWNYEKNYPLTPQDLKIGSSRKIWWICEKGHETYSIPRERREMCSKCELVLNNFSTLFPQLVHQWSQRNKFTPDETTPYSNRKVWWVCEKGHEWETPVKNRAYGKGCPYCANVKVSMLSGNSLSVLEPNVAKFWHPTLNNPATPDDVIPTSSKKVWWQCDKGHEWQSTVLSKLLNSKDECPVCNNTTILAGVNDIRTTHPGLMVEANPGQNLDGVSYGSDRKIEWTCEQGHSYQMRIRNRAVRGDNCPFCKISKSEQSLSDFLEEIKIPFVRNIRKIISPLELDIYIPEKNIAIEFNGVYWHSEKFKSKNYHYDKWLACKEQGIQLIQIWEDDWNRNPELVKQMLTHKLGVNKEQKVYARETKIVQLTGYQSSSFFSQYHIQGAVEGGIRVGLVEKNNPASLVSVMVLKREPGTEDKTLNLLRFATSKPVVGGFTKLLSHVEKIYSPETIITFSDNCVSDGGLYEKNGFVVSGLLKSDYKYVVNGERVHKFNYRLKRFKKDPALLFEDGLTERELAQLNNLPRIWDAGKIRWKLVLNG